MKSGSQRSVRTVLKCAGALAAGALIAACAAPQDESGGETQEASASELSGLCATAEETARVREFYSDTRPGAVLPIPGRKLEMVESKIASGLAQENAVGVEGSPERLAEIWQSIDAWGEDTNVRLVVSPDGWHPFDFPSKTPVTQAEHSQGFYDVYAKGEDGVHIHLKPEDVKLIYAAKLPDAEGTVTRAVTLYDSDGRLIIGVYASKAGNADFDPAAVSGFEGAWSLIESMPRACAPQGMEG